LSQPACRRKDGPSRCGRPHDAQSHLLVPADSAADRPSTLHGLRDSSPHLVQFSARFHCLHCGADHETKVGAACLQTTLARTASSETRESSELEENTEVH